MDKQTSFVTITYENDLRMLLLQLLSIDRLFTIDDIKYYYIIVNSDNTDLANKINVVVEKILSNGLFSKLKIINSKELLTKRDFEKSDGQRSQQLIKMLISQIVGTKHYIILDAKNFFFRKSDISLFIEKNSGKYITNFSILGNNWKEYVDKFFEAIGVDRRDEDLVMPTITHM